MKRLFDEYDQLTEEGGKVFQEFKQILYPVIIKYMEEKRYGGIDLRVIINNVINPLINHKSFSLNYVDIQNKEPKKTPGKEYPGIYMENQEDIFKDSFNRKMRCE